MILAIDTATRSASLAVFDGAVVRAEYSWDTADHHTVELMPRIVDMLRQIDVPIEQITGLGVSIGPARIVPRETCRHSGRSCGKRGT